MVGCLASEGYGAKLSLWAKAQLYPQSHRLPQLNDRHGVATAPVVVRHRIKIVGAGHIAGRLADVLEFYQRP